MVTTFSQLFFKKIAFVKTFPNKPANSIETAFAGNPLAFIVKMTQHQILLEPYQIDYYEKI